MKRLTILTILGALSLLGAARAGTDGAPAAATATAATVYAAPALPAGVEQQLINGHPSQYYQYAFKLFSAGDSDAAVFWLYVGKIRYHFLLAAQPGDASLFSSLEELGAPLNRYAGQDPKKLAAVITAALDWDAAHDNGYTSKTTYADALTKVRAGLMKLRDYVLAHQQEMLAAREENGVGQTGMVKGVYVEEQHEKMPKQWSALEPASTLASIKGDYKWTPDSLVDSIFFHGERLTGVESYEFGSSDASTLLVTAFDKGHKAISSHSLAVKQESGAVVFEEVHEGKDAGLSTGKQTITYFLRSSTAGDLVIQRDYLTEGTETGKTVPERLSYTFWNHAPRLTTAAPAAGTK